MGLMPGGFRRWIAAETRGITADTNWSTDRASRLAN